MHKHIHKQNAHAPVMSVIVLAPNFTDVNKDFLFFAGAPCVGCTKVCCFRSSKDCQRRLDLACIRLCSCCDWNCNHRMTRNLGMAPSDLEMGQNSGCSHSIPVVQVNHPEFPRSCWDGGCLSSCSKAWIHGSPPPCHDHVFCQEEINNELLHSKKEFVL